MNAVSAKIRKVYGAEFGDWCYEKGKKREVMLLKEACDLLLCVVYLPKWKNRRAGLLILIF